MSALNVLLAWFVGMLLNEAVSVDGVVVVDASRSTVASRSSYSGLSPPAQTVVVSEHAASWRAVFQRPGRYSVRSVFFGGAARGDALAETTAAP